MQKSTQYDKLETKMFDFPNGNIINSNYISLCTKELYKINWKRSLKWSRSRLRNTQLVSQISKLIQMNISTHYLFSTFGQHPYIIICMCIRDKLHPHDACKKH